MQPKYLKKTGYNVGKDKSSEDLIYLHMSNHYRKILNAKKAVDNSPPHSYRVKRPVTGNPSRSNKTRRPVENLALTDRSISTNSNKDSSWGVESFVGSSRYHVRCIPREPTYKPNLVNNSLNMMLVDRIAYDTKHGPSAYCDGSWLVAKPQQKDKHYKSAYEGRCKKNESPFSASVKRHHSATTSNDTTSKGKLAVQTRTGTSSGRITASLEPSHCKCPRLCICDANEIVVKKISHNPKEQCLTSSRDSAYNGGVSSGPESRSPTPDQRKKKDCCCCCPCDRKQRVPITFHQKSPPSAASSPRPPDSIDTPRTPKKNVPPSPPTSKNCDRFPLPLPPKIKHSDCSHVNGKNNSIHPKRDDLTVSFFPRQNNETNSIEDTSKYNPNCSSGTAKNSNDTSSSFTPNCEDPLLSTFTSKDNKPIPSPRTLKKSYQTSAEITPKENNSGTSPVRINVNPNQPEPIPPLNNNNNSPAEKNKNLLQEPDSFKKLQEDAMYVTFIQDITMEVIQKNLYTNKALKKVMKKHIQNNLKQLDKDRMLKEVDNLRIQLGIPKDDSLLDLDAECEENPDTSKFYPVISDSEFLMPKITSIAVSNSETGTSESILNSISRTSDRPISTSESNEDLISVIEVTKAVRERRKETITEELIGQSSDDSDWPSDPKKRTLVKTRKISRPFSSSSSDREMEDSSKDTFLGDLELLKKNKNVSFCRSPEPNRGVEIKHKKTVTRTKESICRCEHDQDHDNKRKYD